MHKLNPVDHTKNIVEIENVFFSYDGKDDVLENINLQIHQGDYIGFVGPNGSGKTTLIKIMVGLLKVKRGLIKFFGEEIHHFKDWQKIGYVPQQMTGFDKNFPISVKNVVRMGKCAKRKLGEKNTTSEDEISVQKALEKVDMWDYRERLIGDLSGGQLQRVFIARALVNNPEIIFLDEPTTGIDDKSQKDFYQLMQKLNKELGITLIIVSHDIEKLTQEVMHMVCINRTLTCHTTPEEFIKESQSSNIFGQDVKIMTHHKHI